MILHYTADPARLQQMAERLWSAVAAGWVKPEIGGTFALGVVGEAHRLLESRGTRGALVVVP